MAELELVSESPAATESLAALLAAELPPGALLALDGELGSGKTTFVRGLARGLGCQGPVTSPTFTLMHLYPGPRPLYHFDAWMAGRERAFLDSGGAEHLSSEGVAAVEWAERVAAWLPRPRLELRFGHRAGGATGRAAAGDGERSIAATVVPASDARDASAALLAEALDRALGRALARLPAGVRLAPDRSREPRSARRVGRPEAP